MTKTLAAALAGAILLGGASRVHAQASSTASAAPKIRSVLLLSIDGMHALDFANCTTGMSGLNNGQPYCPNLAALAATGVNYLQASTTKPSDSFPGMAAQFTGGTSRSTGFYYDVTYNRVLSPPAQTTPYGIVGGANLCPGTVGSKSDSMKKSIMI